METRLVSRMLSNGFWLIAALACGLPAARLLDAGLADLHVGELGLLAAALLAASTLVDSVDRRKRETPRARELDARNSNIRKNLLVVLTASSFLFTLSLSGVPIVPTASLALPVLFLFMLFRCATSAASAVAYPACLSTHVLLLGNGQSSEMTREIIQASKGRFILEKHLPAGLPDARATGANRREKGLLARIARESGANAVVVSFSERRGAMPVAELMRCRMQGFTVMDVPTFYERVTRKLYLESTTPSWFAFAPGFGVATARLAGKRLFDVLGALFGLALLFPFLPLIALAVRFDSPGPILFRQERMGLGGRSFQVIKFRTMRQDAERESGAVWASANDARVTRLGRFLRQTRLDETPQLFNVLMGQMSLVGPRPERPEFIRELEKDIPFYSERHCVKPGVTGWAQVRYPYGASVRDALEKLRYDLYYIKNQSFWLDMEIVLRTILVVLLRCGAR